MPPVATPDQKQVTSAQVASGSNIPFLRNAFLSQEEQLFVLGSATGRASLCCLALFFNADCNPDLLLKAKCDL